jgi:hypothetical protein
MDEFEDGFFHYDSNYPPLFIQPSESQKENYRICMKTAIGCYLRSSYEKGLKHPNAILDSGLTAGEAALLHFRNIKDQEMIPTNTAFVESIRQSIKNNMNFDPYEYQEIFNKHLLVVNPTDSNLNQKLLSAIKLFLKEVNQTPKGYTYILKKIMQDIQVQDFREKKISFFNG